MSHGHARKGNEMSTITEACRYVDHIRHPVKKAYAKDYYQWCRSGRQGPSPDRRSLSFMGAQAVRIRLDEFFPWPEEAIAQ